MTPSTVIIISLLCLSCNSGQIRKQSAPSAVTYDSNSGDKSSPKEPVGIEKNIALDTTSTDYLIYLIRNNQFINTYWTHIIDSLDIFAVPQEDPQDSMSHLSLVRDWTINDSISVIILRRTTGTDNDEYLITIKNNHVFVSNIHVGDNADSDLSPDNPYFYTQYKIINHKTIKLFNHKITGTEGGDEKDRLISIETFTIQNNGKVIKK